MGLPQCWLPANQERSKGTERGTCGLRSAGRPWSTSHYVNTRPCRLSQASIGADGSELDQKGVGPPYYWAGNQIRYQRREVLKWFVEHTGPYARCGSECGRAFPLRTSRKSRTSSRALRRRHNKDLVTKAVNARRSSGLGGTAPDADTDQRVEDQEREPRQPGGGGGD
jgi:hypothetical protein